MGISRVILVGAVALGAAVGVAPMAQATTTASCVSATTTTTTSSLFALGTECRGLTDLGAPYVFTIGTVVDYFYPRPTSGPIAYIFHNLTITCTSYNPQNGVTAGCTV